jgi:hypothetical protein
VNNTRGEVLLRVMAELWMVEEKHCLAHDKERVQQRRQRAGRTCLVVKHRGMALDLVTGGQPRANDGARLVAEGVPARGLHRLDRVASVDNQLSVGSTGLDLAGLFQRWQRLHSYTCYRRAGIPIAPPSHRMKRF